jgi:two-component system, NtrC family, nitrogen regulation sensor histidine kinase GlnL
VTEAIRQSGRLSSLNAPDAGEILGAMPVAVIVVDVNGHVVKANTASESLLNTSVSGLRGRMLSSIIDFPAGFDAVGDAPVAALDADFGLVRGARLRGDLYATPFGDRQDWHLLTIANGRDVNHGSRIETRGPRRTAIAIAATLAHEIKNPLSGIRGAAQLLERRASAEDVALTSLIRTEVDRVAALIDRMEGFTDTRPLPLAPENIHAVIDHARRVSEQGFGRNLVVHDEYDPSLPDVLADRDTLIQIVINLLKNAAETAEPDGTRSVTITTRYRPGYAVADRNKGRLPLPIELCVMDDGPGAPVEIADQLFEPFVSGKRKGQGLGLALADKQMRDMGGLIQYAREGQPPQTVFRLLLQRASGKGITT